MDTKRMTKSDHPQSFGAFKPVGQVVVAMPDDDRAAAAVRALHAVGFEAEDILKYTAAEEAEVARAHGALMAEKYHQLVIEDLI